LAGVSDHDVVIVGGGVMGSSTAYHLAAAEPALDVVVVEKDPTFRRSSTLLSDGNVRIQFNLEENILMSMHAMEALATFADDMEVDGHRPDVHPRMQGNLFLADEAIRPAALAGMEAQRRLGCEVVWLDRATLQADYPMLAGPAIVGGTLGPRDGSVDPGAVLHAYRRKARSLGVHEMEGEVEWIDHEFGRVTGVSLVSGERLRAPVVVNGAGAWGAALAATAGVVLPILPVMRNVYVVEAAIPSDGMPSVFLPSGVYLLPEAGATWLMAWSRPEDPVGFDFVVDRQRFYDVVWPQLVSELPAFDRLQVVRGWAGLYDVNTFDGNAILGEWPTMRGLHLANGFSGHGFQQCHSVGRYLAECILGLDHALDLSRLGPQRILDGTPVHEHAGRLI
jgi:FAD-dependent oxidoreductase domain-containing protein 1